jgi:hypothetical protein
MIFKNEALQNGINENQPALPAVQTILGPFGQDIAFTVMHFR